MASVRELSPGLAERAVKELNEVPARVPEDLQALKDWIAKQDHLRACMDDQFLVAFLRGCKYSLERAKEKIDMYYSIRSRIPEFFSKRDPSNPALATVIDMGLCLALPEVNPENDSRILLVKQGAYDPMRVSIADVMKVSYMISDMMLWDDDHTIVAGQTIIVDLKGLGFSHLRQVSASLIKKMTSSIQVAYPIRQKGMHFINPSAGFDTMYKIFYNFMTEKIKKRIFVHSTYEDLHKHVSKKVLPIEYGGEWGPIAEITEAWKRKFEDKQQWFQADEKYGTDENKRLDKSNVADILLEGTEGSFRSLEID